MLTTYPKQLFSCLRDRIQRAVFRRRSAKGPVHLIFMFADHFEPVNDLERVEKWVSAYEEQVRGHQDSDGVAPQHTWFYPCEQLHPGILNRLSRAAFDGLGEVELHLHHENDTSDGLRLRLESALASYAKNGAFISLDNAVPRYGFVHGNYALCNSLNRNGRNFCGVNGELAILKETGCYADFTFPSLMVETEPYLINSIYYAKGDPHRPKSYNKGIHARSGVKGAGDLMLIEGPFMIDWRRRKFGIFPYIEYSDIACYLPPSKRRIPLWVRAGVGIIGRPEWLFIKVHGHGANRKNMPVVLSKEMADLHACLETQYNDGGRYMLHYVTAREAFNIIRAAEDGKDGNPASYRDYEIDKPLNRLLYSTTPYELGRGRNGIVLKFNGESEIRIRRARINARIAGSVSTLELSSDDPAALRLGLWGEAVATSNSRINLTGDINVRESFSDGIFEYKLRGPTKDMQIMSARGESGGKQ